MERVTDTVATTLDWLAASVAERVGAGDRPARLARPTLFLGLGAGLVADAIAMLGGGGRAAGLVAVTLTVCGFGALETVVRWLGSGRRGDTPSAGAALMEEWLRRLQVMLSAVLAFAVLLMVLGGVIGSLVLTSRYVAETTRIATVLLTISLVLVDDPRPPDWVLRRQPAPDQS